MQTQPPNDQPVIQQAANMIGTPAKYPGLLDRAVVRFGIHVPALLHAADYQAQQIVAATAFASAPGNAATLIEWWNTQPTATP